MGLIQEIEKGLKKVADFFEITSAGEVHHSEPYNEPKREISQVMTNRGASFTPKSMTLLGELCPRTVEESDYLYRLDKPLRRDQRNAINY